MARDEKGEDGAEIFVDTVGVTFYRASKTLN